MCLVSKNILIVGVTDKGSDLKKLPVRVLMLDTGAQAIRSLKEEQIHTIISHWELLDVPDASS